jgi:hypothetical protein
VGRPSGTAWCATPSSAAWTGLAAQERGSALHAGLTKAAANKRMSEVLIRIKRAVLVGRYSFSEKALLEMDADALTELDVAESILNATAIYKTLRPTSPFRTSRNTSTIF